MKFLGLILSHIILYNIFELDFISITLLVILIISDYFTVIRLIKFFKNKKYIWLFKSKIRYLASIFYMLALIVVSLLLYEEYLSPECKEVSMKFEQCELYKEELSYISRFNTIFPKNFKISILEMSYINEEVGIFYERYNSCTEEDKEALYAEMKQYTEAKTITMEEMWNSTQNIIYMLYVYAVSMLIYIILWNWHDLAFVFRRIKFLIINCRGTCHE